MPNKRRWCQPLNKSNCPRTADEIAKRIIPLHCIVAAAHGVLKEDVKHWLKGEGLWGKLTPKEKYFLSNEAASKENIFRMQWLAESEIVLLWSIKCIERLHEPIGKSDLGVIMNAVPGLFEDTSSFISSAELRKNHEITEEYENIYDLHCDVGLARRNNSLNKVSFDEHVIFYRHYGFNWVTGYLCQAWDDVTPDI